MTSRPNGSDARSWDDETFSDAELRRRGLESALANQERRRRDFTSATPVIEELRSAGFEIREIGDLLRLPKQEYQRSIPILLSWLNRTDWIGLKCGIARTLTHRWAKPVAAAALLDAFKSIDTPVRENRGLETYEGIVKWTIANALSVVADDALFDELVQVARDPSHGRTREMLAYALAHMTNPRAVDTLVELLNDDDLTSHAAFALGKLKAKKATPALKQLVDDPRPLVRREAKKALVKIENA